MNPQGFPGKKGKGKSTQQLHLYREKEKGNRSGSQGEVWAASISVPGSLKVGHGGRVASENRQGALVERAGIFSDTDPQAA